MDPQWTPPARGTHIFVVLRRDDYVDDPLDAVTATKAFPSLEAAQAEADRLNDLNAAKGARYFVRIARQPSEPDRE